MTRSRVIAAMSLGERLDRYVDRSAGPDACWPWTGAYTSHRDPKAGTNRPVLTYQRKSLYAHRVALELSIGRPIGDGLFACHTCDNSACVNPAHLYEGTRLDNARDAVERHRMFRGPRTPEWAARIGASQKGRVIRPESIQKMLATRRARAGAIGG